MPKGFYTVPEVENEPIIDYAPGTPERASLQAKISELKAGEVELPMWIDGKAVETGNLILIHPPHEHAHTLGNYHQGDASHVKQAIDAAMNAKEAWGALAWQSRAVIFLKAAELLAGPYRDKMNAATMLCQSKNALQSEIDAACELIDFYRFNVAYMAQIYNEQPSSAPGMWNRMEFRPLEGFVIAITPFNFTSIAGNLPAAPALMGNTCIWKASNTQIYSAHVIVEILKEAGLPDGVINLVHAPGPAISEVALTHRDFGGIHFTGSTGVFQSMWKTMGNNIAQYKSYPRIVGETGGKDFILAHLSADAKQVATAITRGAFEYQGQKCSAASRAYIPDNLWGDVKKFLLEDLESIKMGTVEDFSNFVNAVIDEKSFDNIVAYIEQAKKDKIEIIAGGNSSKEEGYFIEPTVIVAEDPGYRTMCEEIFGPVMSIHVYKEKDFEATIDLVDTGSPYALTGSLFASDRAVILSTTDRLQHSAGNFYINDKPTGAVVGQQPFGGARASGTNDKAGSWLNLIRWISPRTIKETFVTPTDYRYPFLAKD